MESLYEGDATSVPEVSEKNKKGRLFSWSLADEKSSSPKIWNSRLSWKIVLAVFLTIMTVQASILALTLKNYQDTQLYELEERAVSILSPMIEPQNSNSFLSRYFEKILSSSLSNLSKLISVFLNRLLVKIL